MNTVWKDAAIFGRDVGPGDAADSSLSEEPSQDSSVGVLGLYELWLAFSPCGKIPIE